MALHRHSPKMASVFFVTHITMGLLVLLLVLLEHRAAIVIRSICEMRPTLYVSDVNLMRYYGEKGGKLLEPANRTM